MSSSFRRSLLAAALLLAAIGALAADAPPARAHAFQVDHRPAQGQRLEAVPDRVALQFSEPVVADTVRVTVENVSQTGLIVGRPVTRSDGRVVDVTLAEGGDGVYVVAYEVVSALDAHVTSGEFAFAVGKAGASLPPAGAADSGADPLGGVATWLVAGGLAAVTGAMLVHGGSSGVDQRWAARAGLVAGAAGAGLRLFLDSGPTQDVAGSLLRSAASIAALVALLAFTIGAFTIGLQVTAVSTRPRILIVPVTTAAVAWSARSHAAGAYGLLGVVLDAVHLLAASAWIGFLALATLALWRAHGDTHALIRRYAGVAGWLVAAVVATGFASAAGLVGTLDRLLGTPYGQLLLAKGVAVAVALVLAVLARRHLRRATQPKLRRVMTGELVTLAGALTLTGLLTTIAPPVSARAARSLLGPEPITGPLARAAGLAGNITVAVTAGEDRLRIEVFAPSGPIALDDIAIAAHLPDGREATLRPRGCGDGCLEQRFALADGQTAIVVHAVAEGWTGGSFTGVLRWPPGPPAVDRLAAVLADMRAEPAVELTEQVTSLVGSPAAEVRTRLTGERLVEFAPYGSGEVVDVRAVIDEPDHLVFGLPAARLWFDVWVDDAGRLARERIVSPGHVIERSFRYPDDA